MNSESLVHNISKIVRECINATVSGSACYAPTPYTLPVTAMLAAHAFIVAVLGLGILVAAVHLAYMRAFVRHGNVVRAFNGGCAPCRLTAIIIPIRGEPRDVVLAAVRRFAELEAREAAVLVFVSDDDEGYAEELRRAVAEEADRLGVNAVFLWRGGGGYKGSAINWAIQRLDADCFLVVDVDSVLPRDAVRRAWCAPRDGIAVLGIDGYAAVRSRFGEAMEFLYKYLLRPTVFGRYVLNRPMLAYGSGGLAFRREFIERVGWFCDCAAEDFDISMRAWLHGSGVVLVPGDPVLVEVPATYSAFRRQHFRWSSNGVYLIRRYLFKLVRAKLPLTYRVELGIHMALHPFSMLVTTLFMVSDLVTGAIGLIIPPLHVLLAKAILSAMLLVNTYYAVRLARRDGMGVVRALANLARASAIYAAIAIPTVIRMTIEGLSGRIVWRSTPKGASQLGYREVPLAEYATISIIAAIAAASTLYGVYTLAAASTWWLAVLAYALFAASRR